MAVATPETVVPEKQLGEREVENDGGHELPDIELSMKSS
jgi:hypothetical protein